MNNMVGGAIRILVVEDEVMIRHMLEDALTDGGFVVTTAESGESAVSILNEHGTAFRALVTDVNLPGRLTGWEVARHAREVNELIPVIYTTGAGTHAWAAKGVPNSLLLRKPFAIAQVVTAVSQLINGAAVAG